MYGAQLIEALRRREPAFEFFGVGGERMRAAGCDTVVDAKALAVVGITEIVSHLREIYGLFDRLIAEADRRQPDLAIVIDDVEGSFTQALRLRNQIFYLWTASSDHALHKIDKHSVRGEIIGGDAFAGLQRVKDYTNDPFRRNSSAPGQSLGV